MSAPPLTIRSLAKRLSLSPATVSDALRGTGRVHPDTRERVQNEAKKIGYHLNPLTTALMSDLRRSRAATFRGVLAAVELIEPDRGSHGPFPRQIVLGARARAKALGFELEEFRIGEDGLTLKRLNSILGSRGINGVMLLPAWYAPDLSALDWSSYAGVYTDCVINRPHLHSVCTDHYRSMIETLSLLHARGYRKPGLLIESGRDERLQLRQTAAFRAFQESNQEVAKLPVEIVQSFSEAKFASWFDRYEPDVVLSHEEVLVQWIERQGRMVPRDCGFVNLNVLNQRLNCSGLDLQPQQLGARAAELLVGQIHQRELGSPTWPTSTMLVARWYEGKTIRRREDAPPNEEG